MHLTDLTEDEILRYINDNISEKELVDFDVKKHISRLIEELFTLNTSYLRHLERVKEYFSYEKVTPYFLKKEIDDLNISIKKSIGKINELSIYSGDIKTRDLSKGVREHVKFFQEGERLHIVFESLLPKRVSNKSPLTIKDIKHMYESAFMEHFSNGKHIIYKEKAVIIYTHYFKSMDEFVDHDNFETKVITDLITSSILLDDSPNNCAIFMDYKMGEDSHTEVDVIPYDELVGFLANS